MMDEPKYNPDNYGAGAAVLASILLALLVVAGCLFYASMWLATLNH